jgi:hypothetical protein
MAFANITGMNIGQDLRLVMFQPVNGAGGSFTDTALGRIVSFNAVPVISEIARVPLTNGGVRVVRNVYQGWNGDMDFVRYNGNLSTLMASIMGIFNTLGNESYFNIDALIYNQISQTTDTLTFLNCVLSQANTGSFGETAAVEQRLHFEGQNILFNGQELSALPSGLNNVTSGGGP